jgi:hypothetical protein
VPRHFNRQEHDAVISTSFREVRCRYCQELFYLCRFCDRGQAYCSENCKSIRQQSLKRGANQRHQKSREGRRDHADRQAVYRAKCKKVTDQGRPSLTDSGKVCAPEEQTKIELNPILSPSVLKESDVPPLLCNPSFTRKNSTTPALGESGTSASCSSLSDLRPSERSTFLTQGALPLDRKAPIRCCLCGRSGEFIRTSALRRIRFRP